MEVTFNFLEIRAMNTYPEHQVTLKFILFVFLLFETLIASQSACVEVSCPHTGCYRHRQDHLLAATADTGPAGSHGQPHQLRPVSSLQQLHLRVSITERSHPKHGNSSFSFGVVRSPRSQGKLADVNSSRQSVGKLAASLWDCFPLQQPNAFLYRCSLHPAHLCVTVN